MGRFIRGILDNDSTFGQLMTRCGIIMGANLMFILFSLPVVTLGPALVALFHVMFKVLRGDGVLNPFKEFWTGFRNNWKQGLVFGLLMMAGAFFCIVDIRFLNTQGGGLTIFKYAVYAVAFVLVILASYTIPVIAAFADTLPNLMRNGIFFAAKNPFKMILIVALNVIPVAVTYIDEKMRPLYVFIWAMCGFGAIVMLEASLLIKDFAKYLPKVDAYGNFIEEGEENAGELPGETIPDPEQNEEKEAKKALDDMKKLGM
ncbi:MAG: YesL family protein [Blautia sp.]|nr:YesL family protein [Blautia sp.]